MSRTLYRKSAFLMCLISWPNAWYVISISLSSAVSSSLSILFREGAVTWDELPPAFDMVRIAARQQMDACRQFLQCSTLASVVKNEPCNDRDMAACLYFKLTVRQDDMDHSSSFHTITHNDKLRILRTGVRHANACYHVVTRSDVDDGSGHSG